MVDLIEMRAAYLAAEAAGDDEAADRLFDEYTKARRAEIAKGERAESGQTFGQMIGKPEFD